MFRLAHFAIAATVLSAPITAAAATTFFTDQTSFDAAVGAVTVEDFASSNLVSGLSYTSTNGSIGGGVFNDDVVNGGASTTFSFSNPATAFGGDFNEVVNGYGQGLEMTLTLANGSTVVLSQQIAHYDGFFGFTTTTPFTSVEIGGGDASGSKETYTLDNLAFNTAPTGGVPEPGAWALLLLGVGAIGGAMRRVRSSGLGQLGSTARLG